MNKGMVIVLVVVLLAVSGCGSMQQAGYFERLTQAVNSSVDAQQTATQQIVEAIKESEALPAATLANIEAKIETANEYVDIAQIAAAEAAKVYEEKRAEDPVGATIEAMRKANVVSAPVNPYAPLIEGGLAIAAIVAGGYGAIKRKELSTISKKYDAHKQGTEAVMRSSDPAKAQQLYDEIGKARKELKVV